MLGKIKIYLEMELLTGLHISGNSTFSKIGTIDTPVVKDILTEQPYIPGSSIKGKMRYLLSRSLGEFVKIEDESDEIKRLFGDTKKYKIAKLQFSDAFMTKDTEDKLKSLNLDTDYTEVKYENTINRLTAIANPRQIERVPRGSKFEVFITYTISNLSDLNIDFENIISMLKKLEDDYLGGNGTRGYGRIKFTNIETEISNYSLNESDYEKVEEETRKLEL